MAQEKSLKFSALDGFFASVMTGFTLNYTIPFALVLGATFFQIGLLTSFPQIVGSFIQLKSVDIVEKVKGRVRFITICIMLQALSWIAISVLHFIFKKNPMFIYIVLVTFNTVSGALFVPAWYSLMSDTVDKNSYGKYFAWRGRIMGFINIGNSLLAGFFLYAMTKNIYLAFFVLFAIAGVCRFISGYFVSKMDDIPPVIVPEKAFNYWDFLKRFPKGNFIRFTFFVSGINFATYIASPFFTVYMFKELHFTYAVYTLIVTLSTLIGLLIVPSWGKLADKVGNVKILQICAVFLPVIPVLWCFSGNPYYLFIVNIFAVHLLNGFNLSTFNFIFDAASPAVRTRCIGYFSFTNGLLIGLACLLGGFIVIYVPAFMNASKILNVFYISSLLGAIVNIFGINSLKEVRHSNKIEDSKLILTVFGITPVLELSNEILGLRFHRLKEK